MKFVGRPARALAIAMGVAVVVTAVPAAAIVANTDKVDGKHAVSSNATAAQRAGRLVATNGSGFLPNNIVKQAQDSARLEGMTLAELLESAEGERGPIGPEGPQGEQGVRGTAGPQGERGLIGPEGPQGVKGEPGATGATGSQGPQGISNVTFSMVTPGRVITTEGTVLGSVTLSHQRNYVVNAAVTALAEHSASLQCQLIRPSVERWDDLAQIDVSQRTTVPLSFAYMRSGNQIGNYTVYLYCVGNAAFTVDTGHMHALEVGSMQQVGGGPVIAGRASEPEAQPFE